MDHREHALIVAGGKGTRIKSAVPKQFLLLNGTPVLIHTLQAFFRYSPDINIVLVLPEEDYSTWKGLASKHGFDKKLTIQKGGETRFQSVRNGLEKIEDGGLVAIHDGVRPLVSPDIIGASFRLA
ncbi:MAG TPA: 2-C-methyl-D-erythritol 4-phosphate cytidylyltransferase, partial [Cyclobacteriaceae bacterium]|nr:2-C-methyl-D-erythritol 4-phosphate cytidylyltransferase [Cyclobacteriaceae bacterium]